jgi:adenine deaminase
MDQAWLEALLAVARGEAQADLRVDRVQIVNVVTGEIETGSLLIAGGYFAGVGQCSDLAAKEVWDGAGFYAVPGLIDAHVHLESSLLLPREYAAALAPKGVSGAVADPHELANVAGAAAVRWFWAACQDLPLEVYPMVPSCVPASGLGNSGALLDAEAVTGLLAGSYGLAEVMSFPEVITGGAVLAKLVAAEAQGLPRDGHAPGLAGQELSAYLAAGIASDHEAASLAEGEERLRRGALLMIREGSAARNLAALAPLLDQRYGERIALCTDDRLPQDLLMEGGVDAVARAAIAWGRDPLVVLRAASWNVARHYRLERRGAILPGYRADFFLTRDLSDLRAERVVFAGREVARAGELIVNLPEVPDPGALLASVKAAPLAASELAIPARSHQIRVIGMIPGQLLTQDLLLPARVEAGLAVADPERDLAKLCVLGRHGQGGIGLGFVQGFGLKRGALAGSVAHDHHNLIAAGMSDADLALALARVNDLGGGLVVAADGKILAELALPVAGLLTLGSVQEAAAGMEKLEASARTLGVELPAPFMALSFLGLEVIPSLKLTDRGLIDVKRAEVVSLFV